MLVSAFITAVRRQGKITTDTTDAEILATGDLEIQGRLIPLLRMSHQEYFVAEAQAASYLGRVALPKRSILGAVRHVQLLTGGRATRLPQVALEDDSLGSTGGIPTSWYFDGGSIVLLPRGSDATVRLRYYLRPSAMVSDASAVAPAPSSIQSFTILANGDHQLVLNSATGPGPIDVITSGGSHAIAALEASTASLSTSQTLLAASIISPVSVGDYVVAAGFSPFVPVPEEMAAPLVHQVAYVILRSLGYEQEATSQKTLAEESMSQARVLLAPRSEGNPKRIRGGIRRALGAWGSW